MEDDDVLADTTCTHHQLETINPMSKRKLKRTENSRSDLPTIGNG
jgi:hypothetical protein